VFKRFIGRWFHYGRAIVTCIGLATFAHLSHAQNLPSLFDVIDGAVHALPGAGVSMIHDDVDRGSLTYVLSLLLQGQRAEAETAAAKLSYRVVFVQEHGIQYDVAMHERGVGPMVVLNRQPLRDLVVEVPHPRADRLTDMQAGGIFVATGARALLIAGAHRCADEAGSTCSGKSAVCGNREAYRRSDVAHAMPTAFHGVHVFLTEQWSQALVVQLHGFSNPGSPAWFVLSDGTKRDAALDAPHHRIRASLRQSLGQREVAISCQDRNDRDVPTRWLCGRWNVQGRQLNGSPQPCTQGATTLVGREVSSRFVHIEQTYKPLREPFSRFAPHMALQRPGPMALVRAISEASNCISVNCSAKRP
jgi:hypothetical protein